MPPTRSLPPPVYVSTELANIPFRFRRKSLSEDDLPNPDYYLVPPSPSLSPSRSFSMSSSPPSSPTALNTSPTGPPHLDTAKIHPASSPAHPTTYHGYGYAYTYSRGLSHFASSHHDISSAPPKFVPPNSRSHPHPIISPPTTNPTRSTFSPTPAGAHGLRPSFASLLRKGAVHDEDEDDIEDYGFALDLDDILTGSSPTRRISFTTSSERDRPFMRSPVKPRLPRSRALPNDTATRPFPTSSATTSSIPVELTLRPREAQCDSTRTSAAPADIPLPLAAPATPIRARSDPRHVAPPFPSMGGTADADLDDTLPPSSPIVSPLSSPLSTPSTSRPSDSGCGSDSSHTVRRATPPGEDRQQLHSDLTLPPSSPNPVPYTPARSSDTKREDDGMDMEMDLDLADLVASPPSPTLDALRITSRVAVRALLNPAPPPVSAPLPVPESIPDFVDDVLPQLEMPNEGEIEVEAETEVEGAEEKMVSILDGDVTPLVLPEASEEVVVT
ncbi:hypothetical protein LXA43DRAFT_1098280 [Ganoderma leucocontextum]|nr:hypothetical protein LXA43DRAFT_1098280 [Ganoderma leucocontextum]